MEMYPCCLRQNFSTRCFTSLEAPGGAKEGVIFIFVCLFLGQFLTEVSKLLPLVQLPQPFDVLLQVFFFWIEVGIVPVDHTDLSGSTPHDVVLLDARTKAPWAR